MEAKEGWIVWVVVMALSLLPNSKTTHFFLSSITVRYPQP